MTELLISVRSAAEARVAIAAGCDWVDIKEPTRGPLGRADAATWKAIAEECGRARTRPKLTVALGETIDDARASHLPPSVTLAKLGPSALPSPTDAASYADAIRRVRTRFGRCDWATVAYADAESMRTAAAWRTVIDTAAKLGDAVVLVDTCDKHGPRLLDRWTLDDVCRHVELAHEAGLKAAIAGRLRVDELGPLAACGVDILGVRSAACGGDRMASVELHAARACVRAVRQ